MLDEATELAEMKSKIIGTFIDGLVFSLKREPDPLRIQAVRSLIEDLKILASRDSRTKE